MIASRLLLVVLSVCAPRRIHGFQSVHRYNARQRQSPLYYSDNEQETWSITTPPPIVIMNGTSIVVKAMESAVQRHKVKRKQTDKSVVSTTDSTNSLQRSDVAPAHVTHSTTRKSHKATWNTRFKQLLQYHSLHNHTLVPQNYPPNPALGQWVMAQRRQYSLKLAGKPHSLNQEKELLLDSVGFVWRAERRGPRGGAYASLHQWTSRPSVICGGTLEDVESIVDFEKYMIQKREELTEDDVREAWRRRFRMLR